MKIKLMNLFAASFAAATLFSCSNEIEEQSGGNALNPGEAGIEIDLGGGKTTYSTDEQEKAVLNGSGRLFTADGVEIPFKEKPTIQNGMFVGTVVLPEGKPIVDAELFLYANIGEATITDGAGATAKDQFANATAAVALTREMPSLPAGLQTKITLNEGSNTGDARALKRSVSRIGAKTGGASIAGFKVSFDNVNITGSTIFKGSTDVADEKIPEYSLTGSTTGTGSTEAIAYIYPSTNVKVTITPPTGSPAEVVFTPELNKNYTLVITPADPTSPEGSTEITVTIAEWETTGDMDVNFGNGTMLTLKTDVTLPAGISVKNNKLQIAAGTVATNPTTGIVIPLNLLLTGYDVITNISPVEAFAPPARVSPSNATISKDKRFAIGVDDRSAGVRVYALTNYGEDKTYRVVVANELMQLGLIDLVVKGLPENFMTTFADLDIMNLPFNTSIDVTAGIVEKINKTTGANFKEKLINFSKTSEANFKDLLGTGFNASTYSGKCPAGFRQPTSQDFVKILGRGYSSSMNQVVGEEYATMFATGTHKVKQVLVDAARGNNGYAFTLQDTKNREITLLGTTNIVEVVTAPNPGFNRFVLWKDQVLTAFNNGVSSDTYLRCVKAPQADLAYN